MFLRFEENPNCGFVEDRVWKEHGEPRVVTHVLRQRDGKDVWCSITGLKPGNVPMPAMAIKVEDSGEGMCWLVFGGLWGLRIVHGSESWGEPFLLLAINGQDLRFAGS